MMQYHPTLLNLRNFTPNFLEGFQDYAPIFFLFQTSSEAISLEVTKRPHPKFACVSVFVSIFYLLL